MVDDMDFGNVMHQVLAIKNGRSGAFQECISLRLIFGNVGLRMMEVAYSYDPMLDPYARHHVQQSDSFQSDLCSCVPEPDELQTNASIGR